MEDEGARRAALPAGARVRVLGECGGFWRVRLKEPLTGDEGDPYGDGDGSWNCFVEKGAVYIPVTDIELHSPDTVSVDSFGEVDATIAPSIATDQNIEWLIEDQKGNDVADFDEDKNGFRVFILGKKKGVAKIKATVRGSNKTAVEKPVTVVEPRSASGTVKQPSSKDVWGTCNKTGGLCVDATSKLAFVMRYKAINAKRCSELVICSVPVNKLEELNVPDSSWTRVASWSQVPSEGKDAPARFTQSVEVAHPNDIACVPAGDGQTYLYIAQLHGTHGIIRVLVDNSGPVSSDLTRVKAIDGIKTCASIANQPGSTVFAIRNSCFSYKKTQPAVKYARLLNDLMKKELSEHKKKKTARCKKLAAMKNSCKKDYVFWKYTLYNIPTSGSSKEELGMFYLAVAKKIDLKTTWSKKFLTVKPGGSTKWKGQGLAISSGRIGQVFYEKEYNEGKRVGWGYSCVAMYDIEKHVDGKATAQSVKMLSDLKDQVVFPRGAMDTKKLGRGTKAKYHVKKSNSYAYLFDKVATTKDIRKRALEFEGLELHKLRPYKKKGDSSKRRKCTVIINDNKKKTSGYVRFYK